MDPKEIAKLLTEDINENNGLIEHCGTCELKMTEPDSRPDNEYDATQLAVGIKVESEHTDDVNIAKKIAKDHLDESPDYYTRLRKMESKF